MDLTGLTTFSYDANRNNTGVVQYDGLNLQMSYDKENRLTVYNTGTRVTFTYSGDGLKRSESEGAVTTTLIWDGDDYLQGGPDHGGDELLIPPPGRPLHLPAKR